MLLAYTSLLVSVLNQGSPQEKVKAVRVGVAWAVFVTTSVILVTTSKKYGYRRHGGAAMLKGPRENTD